MHPFLRDLLLQYELLEGAARLYLMVMYSSGCPVQSNPIYVVSSIMQLQFEINDVIWRIFMEQNCTWVFSFFYNNVKKNEA